MTTLFTHSYFLRFDPKEYKAMMPYPPLGTLYAAAVARDAGHDVALFDAMLADSEEEIEAHILATRPEVVVIYDDDFNYLTKMCLTRMREAACRMAAIAKQHGCAVIVHGSDPTDHFHTYFDAGADAILLGESEITLKEVLEYLAETTERPMTEIAGVVVRNANGEIVQGPRRGALRDLDQLPFPARDLVDIDRYRAIWTERHGYFSLNIATTRGCPFHCNWCAKPLYGQSYSSHSPERVAAEMELLKKTWNPDHLWICDDIFGLKPGWMETFANQVQRRNAAIPFKCLSRADLLLRGNTIGLLQRAGCRTVWMGAESGSQKVLDAMEKGTTIQQIEEATRKLRGAGIHVGYFLQFGYPGEGKQEIADTLAMVQKNLPDEIGISVSYPLPGTPFYQRVKAQMKGQQNWRESADLAMMFQGAFSTQFYRRLAAYVHKKHRLWLGLRLLRALAQKRGDATHRIPFRRALLAPYYAIGALLLLPQLRFHQQANRLRKLQPPRPAAELR